ncbi:MAG: hypothetical protein IJS15_15815 [Victivallales bacterium]|nr:hypothetical protein [Victivallales bacterium]
MEMKIKCFRFLEAITMATVMTVFSSCASTKATGGQASPDARATVSQSSATASPVEFAANSPAPEVSAKLKVGLFLDEGCRGNGALQWVMLLAHSPQVELTLLDGKAIRDGKLNGLKLLVCPGGGGAKQIGAMKPAGYALVKKFVEEGGSYLGICAGSYNAMNREGRFGFLPYDYIQGAHGKLADLAIDFNEQGAAMLGIEPGRHIARYNGGNVMTPTEPTGKGEAQVLAVFKSSTGNHDKVAYNFIDTPAAVFGKYGKGKVAVTSFHPESYESTHCIALGCVYALSGIKPVPVYPQKSSRPLRVGFLSLACVGPRAANELLELDGNPALDVDIFSLHEINEGRMRHYDVVIMPDGDGNSYKNMFEKTFYKGQFDKYLEQRGRIVASGNGAQYLPKNANVKALPVGESFVKHVLNAD